MTPADFLKSLENYADLAVKVGLNLKPGQRLLIINPSARGVQLHVAPLVRQIVASAYRAGARFVDVIWGDEALTLIRFQNAPPDSFIEYADWQVAGMLDHVQKGDALLTVRSNNPDLLSDQDPQLVATAQETHVKKIDPFSEYIARNATNWSVIAAPGPAWAAKVFPDAPPQERENMLWKTIFEICRLDQPDPVFAWQKHIQDLVSRSRYLNSKQYVALKLTAPGTSLTIGLPKGHIWGSARFTSQNGIDFTANLPTEEVFTLPHREQIDGTVSATLPLSYGGALIEDFHVKFERGRAVEAHAKKGETVLRKLLETDEGAASLGEIALVPHSSPIANRGQLFFDVLIDENAASHIAFGRAYRFSLQEGEIMTDEVFTSHGGNKSVLHVDFMIGSKQMDVLGVKEDGIGEPLMRGGEWAFDAQ